MNDELFDSLMIRLRNLNDDYNTLLKENQRLKNKNDSLSLDLKEKNEQINHFQNQEKITKIVTNAVEGGENSVRAKELKRTINEYIKEIDRCINLLHQ